MPTMMKCTMLFDLATNTGGGSLGHRIAGWSESWYRTPDSQTVAAFLRICQKRAALLPIGARVSGQRYQQVDPVGASSTGSFQFPGTTGIACDVPQMALLVRAGSAASVNHRPTYLRGLPDARVVQGEYFPTDIFSDRLIELFNQLQRDGFAFRGRDLSQPLADILDIDALGVVKTAVPFTIAIGDYVRILKTVDSNNNLIGGRFYVNSQVPPDQFTLRGWHAGVAASGKVRRDITIYPLVSATNWEITRVVVRKVGRPFGQYRGRASTRR